MKSSGPYTPTGTAQRQLCNVYAIVNSANIYVSCEADSFYNLQVFDMYSLEYIVFENEIAQRNTSFGLTVE